MLESFLDHARQNYTRGLPRYVAQAFRDSLTCGVFAHGLLRFHCDDRRRDLLVAFGRQGRGICPSCAGRRMANTAAHLVDRVLPAVPVRQSPEPGLDGVAWYCERCSAEIHRHVFDTATTFAQEGYLAGGRAFDEDPARRRCACGWEHAAVDLEGDAWEQLAEQLRS